MFNHWKKHKIGSESLLFALLCAGVLNAAALEVDQSTQVKGEGVLSPDSTCFHYVLLSANIGADKINIGESALTVINVWKQGGRIRVEDENGNGLIISPEEVIFWNGQGKGYRSRSESRHMLAFGGGFRFLSLMAFLDDIHPKKEPTKIIEIDGIQCGVFPMSDLSTEPGMTVNAMLWLPLKQADIPTGFLRMQLDLGKSILEVRLVTKSEIPKKATAYFDVSVSKNIKEVDEDEILELVCEWMDNQ